MIFFLFQILRIIIIANFNFRNFSSFVSFRVATDTLNNFASFQELGYDFQYPQDFLAQPCSQFQR